MQPDRIITPVLSVVTAVQWQSRHRRAVQSVHSGSLLPSVLSQEGGTCFHLFTLPGKHPRQGHA